PLVDLNCAGLGRDLVESELFGHAKGAFTGAVSTKRGLFEVANRGTVFLDEIGDLDPAVQPKLLKAIEERRLRRVGEVENRSVDIRLLAATSRDLTRLTAEGTFRTDLYYRVSTIVLTVPPLRERGDDIPAFAEAILDTMPGRRRVRLLPEAVDALREYPWPGNLRELRNVLERAVLLSPRDELRRADLLFGPLMAGGDESRTRRPQVTRRSLAEVERQAILEALEAAGGRVTEAAQRLDIPRSTLYAKLKAFGISSSKP
ncbi:MAG: sigma 54-interacting transcriptional regulator, partial [Candidatus Woesearchaeota archaeon]